MQKNQNAENVGEVVSYENNGSSKYTTTLNNQPNICSLRLWFGDLKSKATSREYLSPKDMDAK